MSPELSGPNRGEYAINGRQIQQIGELLEYSLALRRDNRPELDSEMIKVLERLKADAAITQEHYPAQPSKGYEIAASGVLIGAMSSQEGRLAVINHLLNLGLLSTEDHAQYADFLADLLRSRVFYGASSDDFGKYLHNLLVDAQRPVNRYVNSQLQENSPTARGLELLMISTAIGASSDPVFRQSRIWSIMSVFVE